MLGPTTLFMIATLGEIKCKAYALVSAASYSLRYGKSRWNPNTAETAFGTAPSRILALWKSAGLPHYLLCLQYLPTRELVDNMQVALTRSLEATLPVYGEKTAIHSETGIPTYTSLSISNQRNFVSAFQPAPAILSPTNGPSGSLSPISCPVLNGALNY